MALTVAWVPTGMKMGVSITPCAVWSLPRRARVVGSLVINSNFTDGNSHQMAGHIPAVFNLAEWRLLNTAAIDGNRAARVESATRRWIDRRRDIAPQNHPLPAACRIRNWDGAQQSLRVGVFWRRANLAAGSDLHQFAEIHHANPTGNMCDHW